MLLWMEIVLVLVTVCNRVHDITYMQVVRQLLQTL